MGKGGLRKLTDIGKLASVEVSDDGYNIVHIHFMNTSIRMCVRQFERFAMMLNEAMMQLDKSDDSYSRMREKFNIHRGMKHLDFLGKKSRLN
jgi:hypothetical protein